MEINNPDSAYWIALNAVPELGAVHMRKLIERFKTAQNVWDARENEINRLDIFPRIKASLLHSRKIIDPARLLSEVQEKSYQLITLFDHNYPSLLKEIYDPPMMLFVMGNPESLKESMFSVVGTRKITAYGERVTRYFTGELVKYGFTIVSGMARGIDSLTHHETILQKGSTVAVLGSGLNEIYPSENKGLAKEIAENGCVISEFPLSMPPLRQNFPIRNRIISGLSRGLLVIEAAEQSGTINIANQALDQNRDVFAIPGSIFNPLSKGTNLLIKNGAKACQTIDDILEELGLEIKSKTEKIVTADLSEQEKIILERLTESDMVNTDELVKILHQPISQVNVLLTKMELKGLIVNMKGSRYGLK